MIVGIIGVFLGRICYDVAIRIGEDTAGEESTSGGSVFIEGVRGIGTSREITSSCGTIAGEIISE